MDMVEVEEAVREHQVVVGAGTTGEVIDPRWLRPQTALLDVALPSSLKPGPRPKGLLVLAAEAMELPEGWSRGFWGRVYHLLAGYGPSQVFACLAEPMVMAAQGRTQPYAQGRRLPLEQVHAFGAAALEMGLSARLAHGWRALDEERLEQIAAHSG
jgi:predicted amino acid dehydrogenase